MQQRLAPTQIAPELSRALGGVNMALSRSGLGQRLLDLIFLRVSQINGCAYCVDMHGRDLRKAGETERRLNAVAVWREAPFFSARERALLGWVEGLTHLPSGPVAEALYEPLREHFSERDIVDITFAAAVINAWNRVALGFCMQPDEAETGAWGEESARAH